MIADPNGRGNKSAGFGWALLSVGLFAFLAVLVVVAIAPGYMSPNSRSWSTGTGYPALRRMLGLPIPVPVALVSSRDLERIVASEGTLQYLNEVPVNVDVSGIVTALNVIPGASVRRGDVLATLDSGGFEIRQHAASVDQKVANYQNNKKDFDRQKDAYKRGLVAQTAYETSERNYLVAAAELQQAREKLAQAMVSMSEKVFGGETDDAPQHSNGGEPLRIVAPIAGKVSRVSAYVGQTLVNPGQAIMGIGDQLLFRATVDQRDFQRVKLRDVGEVRLQALPGRTLTAEVVRVDPTIAGSADQQKTGQPQGTFNVWLAITDPKAETGTLMAGMSGYCVVSRPFRSLAVPESALMRFSGGEGTVLALDDANRVRVVAVQYSVNERGWVGITSGLREGARVVLNGQIGLRAGDLVAPE